MTDPDIFDTIMLIAAIILSLALFIFALRLAIKEGFNGKRIALIIIPLSLLFIVYLVYNIGNIVPSDWAQIIILLGLVAVTVMYALSTAKQAEASVRMAEEMRAQRIITSRPIIILKAVHEKDIFEGSTKDYFSHFEISSVGNTPALEVEISLMDKEGKNQTESIRQTFLRSDDPPIKFRPYNMAGLRETTTYHIVCEYQDVFSNYPQKTFCKTRLPFKPSKSSEKDKIYLVAGELDFLEVSEQERIDAFSSRSKPK